MSNDILRELTATFRMLVNDIDQLDHLMRDNETSRAAQNVRASLGALQEQLVRVLVEFGADATPVRELKLPVAVPPSFAPEGPDSAA